MKQFLLFCGCYLLFFPVYLYGIIAIGYYHFGLASLFATLSGTGLWFILQRRNK